MKEPRIIDLTYTVRSDMMVYPGADRPVFQWTRRANSENVNATKMTIPVHTGTHVDAPKHFMDNVPCIDEIPLSSLFGTAKLFRNSRKPCGQEITFDDLQKKGFDLDEGMIFVMDTGIQEYEDTRQYNKLYPTPSKELCQWLIHKKVKAYMTDTTSVDPVGSADSPSHNSILGAKIPIVENLRNLQQLPENTPFIIGAFPLKLQGRDGSPCRAMALPDISCLA